MTKLVEYLTREAITQADFAARLGVTQGAVSRWMLGERRITAERAVQIERVTGGAVSRYDLRPDVFANAV